MAEFDYDVGIIGGGSAGLTATAGMAQLGVKTLLIEKEDVLGGDCLHYGCVPSKTLIKSAHCYHIMKNGPKYGLPQVDVPPADFSQVSKRIRDVIATIQPHDSEERFCGLGAKVEFGHAKFLDEHKVEFGGKAVSARHWLISSGSEPSAPPIPGLSETPYITNKEIFYLDALPKSMICLGGGPISMEMAQSFQRLGCDVTVIQRSKQILSNEDKDMADMLQEMLEAEGLTIYTETSVKQVRDLGNAREVVFEHKGQDVTISAETLLVALGRSPNVRDLDLDKAGVEYSPKGIPVDARMRSNIKHIYAAGDTTGKHLFTHAAGYEGGIVLANIVFKLPRKADYSRMPWCTYTDPSLGSIGMNEKAAQAAGIEYKVWIEEFKKNDRALAEGEGQGLIKLIVDKSEKPLGVQVLGMDAGNLINEWVAVMNGNVKLSALAGAIHPYPTLGEINKRVAGDLIAPKLFSDTVKKGLKFFFHYRGRACEAARDE